MTAALTPREQVLARLHAHVGGGGSGRVCFVEPRRVDAALQLADEGLIRCWVEPLTHSGGEMLVCELAVRPPRPVLRGGPSPTPSGSGGAA